MNLYIHRILATVSLLLLWSSSGLGQITECNNGTTPCEAYARADAVFIAKVTRISPETIQIWQRDKDYDQTATLVTEKTFKGIKRNRYVLSQLGRKNAPKFILNSRYLFYANFDRVRKQWEVTECGRTMMAQYAHDDLAYLNGLPEPLNKTRIAGTVTRYDRDDENPQGQTQRLAGVRLKIRGAKTEYEVFTDANGVYQLYGAPAGKYLVEPSIPGGLMLFGVIHYGAFDVAKLRSYKIELSEGACSGIDIILTTDPNSAKPKIGN